MTYDPEYDKPDIVRKYAIEKGFRFNELNRFLIPEESKKDKLFEALNLSVNFDEKGVSIHGLELLILDRQGRFVRKYSTLIWENEKVMVDFKRLIEEK
jgi:cytochrome oxidase Cu insertion factor (SCO1/SenC/PrrC family)